MSGPYNDRMTLKLDPLGTPLWTARFSQRTDTSEAPQVLRLAADGSVYVGGLAGAAGATTPQIQGTVLHYAPNGSLLRRAVSVLNSSNADVKLGTDCGVFVVDGTPQAQLTHYAGPPKPSSLTLSRTSVTGGAMLNATVRVNSTAGGGVSLSSSNTAAARVPASVTIPAGANSATFSITTVRVARSTSVQIGASANGGAATATLNVRR